MEVEPCFDAGRVAGIGAVLNSVLAWVWRDDGLNALGLDYDKGLWLHGSLGRGKTMTLRALRRYLVGLRLRCGGLDDWRLGSRWACASELANLYATNGLPALAPYYAPQCCLMIDELGREPNPATNYGTRMDVAQFLLQVRYDNRRQSVTHVTTNLRPDEVAAVYGDYVADRCLEMFNFIEFAGPSLR